MISSEDVPSEASLLLIPGKRCQEHQLYLVMKEIWIYSESHSKFGRESCRYYQKGERWFSLV